MDPKQESMTFSSQSNTVFCFDDCVQVVIFTEKKIMLKNIHCDPCEYGHAYLVYVKVKGLSLWVLCLSSILFLYTLNSDPSHNKGCISS